MRNWLPITGPLPAPTSRRDRLEVYDPKHRVAWPYATYHPEGDGTQWLLNSRFLGEAIRVGALYLIRTVPDPEAVSSDISQLKIPHPSIGPDNIPGSHGKLKSHAVLLPTDLMSLGNCTWVGVPSELVGISVEDATKVSAEGKVFIREL